jgi:hypothetical protein
MLLWMRWKQGFASYSASSLACLACETRYNKSMGSNLKLLMRAAVFLAVVGITFFVMQDDGAGEGDEQPSVDPFVRSAIGTSDKQQTESSAVVAVGNSEVLELHNLALEAVNAKQYQVAYEIMTQLYEFEANPGSTIAVNASRVAGRWANALQGLYRHQDAREVWRQAIAWHHDKGHPQLSFARLLLLTAEVEAAREIVDEALAEFPQHASLLALRAEIASLRGEADFAVEMMQAAVDIESDNARYAGRLVQLKVEAEAFANYLPISTAHFDSSFDPQNISMVRNIDDLQQDLERAWSEISGLLGIQNERRIVVLWLDSNDYKGQAPDWSAGIYDGRIRVVVDDYPERRPQMLATLKHELTHALLHSTGIKFPTFVQEGLAQLYEPRDADVVRDAYLRGDLPSLADLQGNWTSWTDAEQVRAAYAYSLSLCDFVRERYGADSFGLLFENMRGSELHEAWQATFGNTLADSDALHRQFLADSN